MVTKTHQCTICKGVYPAHYMHTHAEAELCKPCFDECVSHFNQLQNMLKPKSAHKDHLSESLENEPTSLMHVMMLVKMGYLSIWPSACSSDTNDETICDLCNKNPKLLKRNYCVGCSENLIQDLEKQIQTKPMPMMSTVSVQSVRSAQGFKRPMKSIRQENAPLLLR
jgi:hypothetical protein